MEEDEIEMSKEELQKLIKDQVEKSMQVSSSGNENYSQLLSLLERKRRQTDTLLSLCQSVRACERTVKELYSLLGWEYSNSDSGYSDAEPIGCRRTLPFRFVSAEHHNCKASTSKTTVPRLSESNEDDEDDEDDEDNEDEEYDEDEEDNDDEDNEDEEDNNDFEEDNNDFEEDNEENHKQHMDRKRPVVLMKEPVVVLTRLSRAEINAYVNLPSSQSDNSEDDSSSSAESDMQWEPEVDTSDSDLRINTRSVKKSKLHENHKKTNRTSQRLRKRVAKISESEMSMDSKNSSPERNVRKVPTSQATSTTDGKRKPAAEATLASNKTNPKSKASTAKTTESSKSKTPLQANTATVKLNQTMPQVNTANSTKPQGNAVQTSTSSANIKEVTSLSQQPSASTSTSSNVPLEEITVNMNILAKRRQLSWHPGKIAEIITKEDGKVKYKVVFEKKGRLLVSGHHIAFASSPSITQLLVGSRVVVQCEKDEAEFKPGILAELPNRKNRMRFLVFIDDHTPAYVSLLALHLVCRPLADPLDDILNDGHRSFVKEYLKMWPYPSQTQYKVGQKLKAEYDGAQQSCEVLDVDCSLIQVVFENDQHKEWIYRGSLRLEHMINLIRHMAEIKNEGKKDK